MDDGDIIKKMTFRSHPMLKNKKRLVNRVHKAVKKVFEEKEIKGSIN